MRAVSPGSSLQDVTTVKAPPSSGASPPYDKKSLLTFLLRKKGDAWNNPFVVAYESTRGNEPFIIQNVQRLFKQITFVGVKVSIKTDGQDITQYIIVQEHANDVYNEHSHGVYFRGQFGIVSVNHNSNKGDLYIGKGGLIRYGVNELKAEDSESCCRKF